MSSVFLSYVSENYPAASRIATILEANGLDVWLDRNRLTAGQSWLHEIRQAIQHGSFFLPLFSEEWLAREKSVANEELLIAIEELRKRPFAQTWLIPVRLTNCELPPIPIGAGRDLRDLHYVDFSTGTHLEAFRALLTGLGVENPDLSDVETEESGWPAQLRIIRRDKWVDKIPFRYFLNSELISDRADGDFTLNLPPTGEKQFYCDTAWKIASPIQTRSGNMQGTYFRGMSEKITPRLLSGHRYELFVSGDNLHRRQIVSPYIELVKMIYQSLGGDMVDMDDPATWPRIHMRLSRL